VEPLLSSGGARTLLTVVEGKGAMLLAISYVLFLTADLIVCRLCRISWSGGDALSNLAVALIGFIVNAGAGLVFGAIYLQIFEHRLWTIPDIWGGLALSYLLYEGVQYTNHRLAHRTGWFWAIHSVHHSSSDYNVPVSARFLWGISLTQPVILILPLLGLPLHHFAFLAFFGNTIGIISHTRWVPRLRGLDHIFMTPSNHRVHHGRQVKYLDVNYGHTLLLFDKIFGTHRIEEEEPDYGLVEKVDERNIFQLQIAGFRDLFRKINSAPRLSQKLYYLVMPPGWSHTGDHRTTAAMRASASARASAGPAPTRH